MKFKIYNKIAYIIILSIDHIFLVKKSGNSGLLQFQVYFFKFVFAAYDNTVR